MLANILSPRIN